MRRKHYKPILRTITPTLSDKFLTIRILQATNKVMERYNTTATGTEYEWYSISYLFYRHLKKIFKNYFNIRYKNSISFKNNFVCVEPVFLYNRQYFAKKTFFYDFLMQNKFDGVIFFKNNLKKKPTNLLNINNNFYITNVSFTPENIKLFDSTDDNKNIFKKKFFYNFFESDLQNLNWFLNFNLYLYSNIEFYKILQYLYIYSLLK